MMEVHPLHNLDLGNINKFLIYIFYLGNNNISSKGIKLFCEILKKNTHLEVIWFRNI